MRETLYGMNGPAKVLITTVTQKTSLKYVKPALLHRVSEGAVGPFRGKGISMICSGQFYLIVCHLSYDGLDGAVAECSPEERKVPDSIPSQVNLENYIF